MLCHTMSTDTRVERTLGKRAATLSAIGKELMFRFSKPFFSYYKNYMRLNLMALDFYYNLTFVHIHSNSELQKYICIYK